MDRQQAEAEAYETTTRTSTEVTLAHGVPVAGAHIGMRCAPDTEVGAMAGRPGDLRVFRSVDPLPLSPVLSRWPGNQLVRIGLVLVSCRGLPDTPSYGQHPPLDRRGAPPVLSAPHVNGAASNVVSDTAPPRPPRRGPSRAPAGARRPTYPVAPFILPQPSVAGHAGLDAGR